MSEQHAGRAIVTFARGWQTLVAVRSLGRRGVEVVAGDQYSMTPGSLSKYCTAKFKYPDPDKDPAGFLDALEAVVLEHKPDDDRPYVLLPIHKESYLIAQHRERFEPHISLALPGIDQIMQVHKESSCHPVKTEETTKLDLLPRKTHSVRSVAKAIVTSVH